MATENVLDLACGQGPYWDRNEDEKLVCIETRQETHDVRTFTFRSVDDRYFSALPGQHFLFDLDIDGEAQSRCYSISSSTLSPRSFSVTVKRVPGGKASNWLHDNLKVGITVRGRGPTGLFALPDTGNPLLLISGGSGITPMMSMVRTLADAHLYPDIVFIHAGRTPVDLVFREELRYRAKVTPKLRVFFLPERVEPEAGYLGVTGRLSQPLLSLVVPDIAERTVMCCGPAPFMRVVRELSLKLGVPTERYIEESFDGIAVDEVAVDQGTQSVAAVNSFKVTFSKQAKAIEVACDQTVLSAARKSGVRIPSSCGNGLCGTCKSKLTAGQVDMQHTGGIRQREINAGYILPCCSKPLSDLVIDA